MRPPARALGTALGGILSDNDPRFTLQPEEAFLALDYAGLREAIGDRLANGAIEIALAGDFDEAEAIAAVAATLGALPMREPEFNPREAARTRSFTGTRGQRILTHQGEADQALLRWVWPTTDDSDQTETLRLALLSRIVRIKLTEKPARGAGAGLIHHPPVPRTAAITAISAHSTWVSRSMSRKSRRPARRWTMCSPGCAPPRRART